MTPRHRDCSEARARRIASEQGPHAAACAEANGTLIETKLVAPGVGRGCGSPTPVVGTSGHAPCGAFVTSARGRREHLCPYCEREYS